MGWTAQEIRKTFIEFFKDKQHKIVPSAPMVIKGDPTLMFTNAGMNQFKDLFLGNKDIESPRIADSQKCLRVSGKHNDLEEVGVDTYHHTMFEMLGNWSFGNYFKEEAISWAWELLTERFELDSSRLYATIFEGDAKDGLDEDLEAKSIWSKYLPESRILSCSKKDNFWEMGDTGPCGPCSEIHIDLRNEDEREKVSGATLVNQDHPQVIEIWNLVFMQFNRKENGDLMPLPNKHVDTGMGFERLCMALQEKTSNYDTDVFSALIDMVASISGKSYGSSSSIEDIAIRVCVDHVRAIAFSIADGQLPSNTGAGYVIRRILRRAVRYGYSYLDIQTPFLFKLIPVLTDEMGGAFPELQKQGDLIAEVLREEEANFLNTLDKGIQRFNAYAENHEEIQGEFAFELYDTYGFPLDLTQMLAQELSKKVDIIGFEKSLEIQKDRSRKAGQTATGDWTILIEDEREEFIGYDYLESEVQITRYRSVTEKKTKKFQLVFNYTPFYPEGGGQVGDRGSLTDDHGTVLDVLDTKKENNVIIHIVNQLPDRLDAKFKAQVNESFRNSAAANHSATHLLHHVLREELGSHVEQKGSLVNEKHLRFDFSHFQKVTPDELRRIEKSINAFIRANDKLEEYRAIPKVKADEMGAISLFGEKYDDVVRLIQFGKSKELCGGTHVKRTGDIGIFKFTSESSVASGIRRVEAVTGIQAEAMISEQEDLVQEMRSALKQPQDLLKSLKDLQQEKAELESKLRTFQKQQEQSLRLELIDSSELIEGVNVIARVVDSDGDTAKSIVTDLRGSLEYTAILIGVTGERPVLHLAFTKDLVEEKGMHAGTMIRDLAQHIQGGGGGQPFMASAGGKHPEGLDTAISAFKDSFV